MFKKMIDTAINYYKKKGIPFDLGRMNKTIDVVYGVANFCKGNLEEVSKLAKQLGSFDMP